MTQGSPSCTTPVWHARGGGKKVGQPFPLSAYKYARCSPRFLLYVCVYEHIYIDVCDDGWTRSTDTPLRNKTTAARAARDNRRDIYEFELPCTVQSFLLLLLLLLVHQLYTVRVLCQLYSFYSHISERADVAATASALCRTRARAT